MTIVDHGGDLIGRVLGDFVLREPIGEGSFGQVFRAEQPILEREAVVKVALAGGRGPEAIKKFLTEARLASRLDHPFAAHVYAFGAEADGTLWIAMELIRGTALSALIEHGPVAPERAIPFMRRLCEVVHTAHELGILHRDLKPDNVMIITRAGNLFPKLLDLGIARDLHADRPRVPAAGSGTPLYMAPELWVAADRAGPPADVYALAAITFELLTGAPPFTGRSVLEIAAQHARRPPPSLPADFPAALSSALAKGLAKRAADRFPTALAFADSLIDSTGVGVDAVNLPQLDEITRAEAIGRAPRPIAEAVALLDVATGPARARAGVHAIVDAITRFAAIVAIGARDRVGIGRHADAPEVVELLAALRERPLAPGAWWKLARELCRPFAELRDVHPVPELVGVFFDGRAEIKSAIDALLAAPDPGANASADAVHAYLAGAVPLVAAAVRAVGFLADYRLVAPAIDGGDPEVWNGVRRPAPARIALAAGVIEGPALVDAQGAVAVALAPYAQAGSPAADAPRELFLVEGPARHGARLRALPGPLERQAEVWADDARALELAAGVAPYRGLSTFTESDAGLFFGREREVDELVNRLRTTPLLAVVGPSGSGKSSFVQAGVLPALGAGGEQAVIVRPGPTPIATLVARLAASGVKLAAQAIRADETALGAALAGPGADRRIVLVVDQFEELFTLCFDAAEQDAYAAALHAAARPGDPSVRVILTLRDDFLIRTVALPALRRDLAARLQLVTTPAPPDLLRILVEPARRAGYAFEDDALARDMVDEVATRPGALALLSFTASKLWGVRDRAYKRMTRAAYRGIGGVGGALAQHAEQVLEEIDADRRPIVREVFRHLVTADGTRAVMSRAELLQAAGGDRAAPVLEALINARLLVAMESDDGERPATAKPEPGDQRRSGSPSAADRIEVVHETLLAAWPRLVAWRQQDAENARLRDQLRAAARQWDERGRPRGLLWRGEALAEYRLWRARYPGGLTAREDAFGTASLADDARARRLRRTALVTVMLAMAVALIVFARLRSTAQASERVARASRARAEASEAATAQALTASYVDQGRRALIAGNPTDALLYLAAARARGHDSPAARFMIARALEPLSAEVATLRHGGMVTAVRFTPDGKHVVTAGDGKLAVWDLDGRRVAAADAEPAGNTISLAVDGARAITGSTAGSIRLWALPGLDALGTLPGGTGSVDVVELSPDGTRLVASGLDGEVRAWSSIAPGAAPVVLPRPFERARSFAALSPTADRVAINYLGVQSLTGAAALWTPGRPSVALPVPHGGGRPAWTRDGTRVVTPGYDGSTRVWTAAAAPVRRLVGDDARVNVARFTDDGRLLATGAEDGSIDLWDVDTGAIAASLRGHTGTVTGLEVMAGSTLLASTGADGKLDLWDLRRHRLINTHNHGGYLSSLAVDPTEQLIATASLLGTVRIWQARAPSDVAVLGGKDDRDGKASVDGRYVIRSGPADTEIWRVADRARVVAPATGSVYATEASRGILALANGRVVQVVDLATGRVVAGWSASADVTGIAIEPGGAAVATISADHVVAVHATADGAQVRTTQLAIAGQIEWCVGFLAIAGDGQLVALRAADLSTIASRPNPLAWLVRSPDGMYVSTAAEWTVAEVWSSTGVVATLPQHVKFNAMEWTADTLAVGGIDGTIHLWRRDTWQPEAVIQAHEQAVRALAVSGRLMASLGSLDVVRVWDLDAGKQVHETRVGRGALGIWFAGDHILVMSPDGAIEVIGAGLDETPLATLIATASCLDSGGAIARGLGLPPCASPAP